MSKWEEKRLEDIIDVNPPVKLKKGESYPFIVRRKPLAWRVVQKRLLPMGKNKTPSVIVEMRSGNCKLQNKGRPLKSE